MVARIGIAAPFLFNRSSRDQALALSSHLRTGSGPLRHAQCHAAATAFCSVGSVGICEAVAGLKPGLSAL